MKHSPRLISSHADILQFNYIFPIEFLYAQLLGFEALYVKRTSTQEIAWFQPTPRISTTSLQDGLFNVHVKLLELVKEFSNHWQGLLNQMGVYSSTISTEQHTRYTASRQ
jgi:hypothetical protein